MRYCYYCKKAMYTSNKSIWIGRKNYDAHIKCIKLKEKILKMIEEEKK